MDNRQSQCLVARSHEFIFLQEKKAFYTDGFFYWSEREFCRRIFRKIPPVLQS